MRTAEGYRHLSLEFAKCGKYAQADNHRLMDAWILESNDQLAGGCFLTAVKGIKTHFVMLQNGSVETAPSGRFRTGLWFGGVQHVSSFRMLVNGKRCAAVFKKQVRKLSYTYREYAGMQRIDFVPFNKACFAMAIKCGKSSDITIEMKISHHTMWPEDRLGGPYILQRISKTDYVVRSDIAETRFVLRWAAFSISLDGDILKIVIGRCRNAFLSIGTDGSRAVLSDFRKNELHYLSLVRNCTLFTPSFEFNKCFLWAKHDLLEFYTECDQGKGFYAGMPEFSWFFGRDGEWMSIAAIECGLVDIARSHLSTLLAHARNGQIPHEIPLVPLGNGILRINEKEKESTWFMSSDSTPLWIFATLLMRRWHSVMQDDRAVRDAVEFCLSCDTDGDSLIENNFEKGLIGWPETWASKRDGPCIEVNAWWLKALEEFSAIDPSFRKVTETAFRNFNNTFFSRKNSTFNVFDSVDGDRPRVIRSPMEVVPAMYWQSGIMGSLVDSLAGDDLITPWGVRSMSSSDPMYDRGYHTGEVWPLMTGWFTIAAYKNGRTGIAFELLKSFPLLSFSSPEPGRINETYQAEYFQPTGQFAQGWSSSLFIEGVIEGLFGINPNGDDGAGGISGTLKPCLPQGWNSMRIERFLYRGRFYDIAVTASGVQVEYSIDLHR